jgi:hypothetical protein
MLETQLFYCKKKKNYRSQIYKDKMVIKAISQPTSTTQEENYTK